MMIQKFLKKDHDGQALVLILLVLIIGATVAFAIAMRTIQEIRRSGQERASDTAANQVISVIDAITGKSVWDKLIDTDGTFKSTSLCGAGSPFMFTNDDGWPICVLKDENIFSNSGNGLIEWEAESGDSETQCDPGTFEIQIRAEDGVNDLLIKKDSVYEVNLTGDSDKALILRWQSGSRLLFSYYSNGTPTGEWIVDGASAYKMSGVSGWPIDTVISNTDYPISFPATTGANQYLRIRAIDGDAKLTLKGIPTQQMGVRGSCYVASTYREFVRIVPLYSFVPAAFDYALFDGTTEIDERSPN